MQARLIGFAFEEEGTSSLFRATWLPIGPGLNVLYGLNGAGKTTVLSSVRSALAGERVKRGGKPAQGCLPHFAVADPGPRNANWEEFTGYIRSLSDLFGGFKPEGWVHETLPAEVGVFGSEMAPGLINELLSSPIVVAEAMSGGTWALHLAVELQKCPTVRNVMMDADAALRPEDRDPDDPELDPSDFFPFLQAWQIGEIQDLPLYGVHHGLPYAWVLHVGYADRLPVQLHPTNDFQDQTEDIDGLTFRSISVMTRRHPFEGPVEAIEMKLPVDEIAALTADVQSLYSSLLLDAPAVHLAPSYNAVALATRPPVSWVASLEGWHPGTSRPHVPIDSLSRSQRFWATFSIFSCLTEKIRASGFHTESGWRAGSDVLRAQPILLIDEPEAGLHRRAERHMARGLASFSEQTECPVLVATHTPQLLDHQSAHLIEVARDDGRIALNPLAPLTRDSLRQLGIHASDLLAAMRILVLVEGAHDVLVLKAAIGPELDRAGAFLLPIRGAKKETAKAIFDSQLIADFITCPLLAVADNSHDEADRVKPAWIAAKGAWAAEQREDLVFEATEPFFPNAKMAEHQFLRAYITRGVTSGRPDPSHFFGLSEPDVIFYLKGEYFGLTQSWAELYAQHQELKKRKNPPGNFKRWLETDQGVEDINTAVAAAVQDLPMPLHPDFERLRDVVQKLAAANHG